MLSLSPVMFTTNPIPSVEAINLFESFLLGFVGA